jgi:undecaprenyl-phosphate 4-deoxy-4-formamido-L-arabinose transferase
MSEAGEVNLVSVVVPVYRGERTLEPLLAEIEPLTREQTSAAGHRWRVGEVILVHDAGPDDSARVIDELARRFPFVAPIWLSRNFGQHPATLAGMSSTNGEWVVTLDEDGQHEPAAIGALLDRALATGVSLVYAHGSNPPPHGFARNAASGAVKWAFVHLLDIRHLGRFSSFRLIAGEIARSLAAYCGHNVYLDVALSWVVDRSESCAVTLRDERGRPSGYDYGKLTKHFGRLLMSSGTRPLRMIAILGMVSMLISAGIAGWALYEKLAHLVPVQGWTSTVLVLSFFSGCILFSLGVVAEYIAVTLSMAMGKPLYLVVSRPPRRARKS